MSATGIELDEPLPPPDLVIQDELHLISGPLGTMAGPLRDGDRRACAATRTRTVPRRSCRSTATVRRATDQIRRLFGRGVGADLPAARAGPQRLVLRR